MCNVCHHSHCPSQCPNAEEPPVYAECDNCDAEIYDGDEYYEIGERKYCEACVCYKTAEVPYEN